MLAFLLVALPPYRLLPCNLKVGEEWRPIASSEIAILVSEPTSMRVARSDIYLLRSAARR